MLVTTIAGLAPGYSYSMLDRNLKTMLLVLAILGLFTTKTRIHALAWMLAISLAYWSVSGALFMAISGGAHRLFGPTASMIGDNNHLAAAILMMFPILNYLRLNSKAKLVSLALMGMMGMTLLALLG